MWATKDLPATRELAITPQSSSEHYTGGGGKSNCNTGEKAHICHLDEWVTLWEGPVLSWTTITRHSPVCWDDTCKISAELRCRQDRPGCSNLNKLSRLLWKPQGWKRSTLKTNHSEADFLSILKRFMTRIGKVGVKCFWAKAIVAALEEEALWIHSTHHTCMFYPKPQENSPLCFVNTTVWKFWLLNPFLALCLLFYYYCSYKLPCVAILTL